MPMRLRVLLLLSLFFVGAKQAVAVVHEMLNGPQNGGSFFLKFVEQVALRRLETACTAESHHKYGSEKGTVFGTSFGTIFGRSFM